MVENGGCPPKYVLATPAGTSGDTFKTCEESRGLIVNITNSSTATLVGNLSVNIDSYIGITAAATYELDVVGLGFDSSGLSPTDKQVVGGLTDPSIWVGLFGLYNAPTNFTGYTVRFVFLHFNPCRARQPSVTC